MSDDVDLSCPVPLGVYDKVVLAHGAGGRLMHRLIEDVFIRTFDDPELRRGHDGAVLDIAPPLATTTDAFTVSPLFFPGGDIGSLAVHGTVNDVAMCGARPHCITAAFVLEEGLALTDLQRIASSMAAAAKACDVRIVAGDTKVVEHGHGDGVYITTTGIGTVVGSPAIGPARVRPGDEVVVSGPVGEHGIAILTAREGLDVGGDLRSDAASVAAPCLALLEAGIDVHCLRDPTRGGLASALVEIAASAELGMRLLESSIPVRDAVADACELFGLDPLHVACEGRFVAIVAPGQAARTCELLRAHGCPKAATVGEVTDGPAGTVVLTAPSGGQRVLDMLAGAQLPRIC